MWNVEYHCDSEVEATNISLSQILPPNMMKSQQYNLKLLIRHQIIPKNKVIKNILLNFQTVFSECPQYVNK